MLFALKTSERVRALALSSFAAVCFAGGTAHAQTFSDIMQDIGIQGRKKEKMDYNERAPLVIPPSLNNLPPPEDGQQKVGDANWPADPDVLRELAEEEADKKAKREARRFEEQPVMSIYDIRNGRRAGTNNDYDTLGGRRDVKASREEMALGTVNKDAKVQQEAQAALIEPERKRLTDPPPGYRQPSPSQPYEAGTDKRVKNSWLTKLNPFK